MYGKTSDFFSLEDVEADGVLLITPAKSLSALRSLARNKVPMAIHHVRPKCLALLALLASCEL